MAEIKGNHVQPVLQLLCFQPKEMLDGMHSISAPYFIYPLEKSEVNDFLFNHSLVTCIYYTDMIM